MEHFNLSYYDSNKELRQRPVWKPTVVDQRRHIPPRLTEVTTQQNEWESCI